MTQFDHWWFGFERARNWWHQVAWSGVAVDREKDVQSATAGEDQNFGLMELRMEGIGLDPGHLERAIPNDFRRMARVCSYCQYKPGCERDLLREFAGEAVDWQRYCPNAPRMTELQSRFQP
jgi:hypothetical protein